MNLNSKRILLTGAAGGIGRLLSALLAARGARLGLVDRDQAAVDALASDLAPGNAMGISGDITRAGDRATFVARMREKFGGTDVLINLAGILDFKRFQETDPATIQRILQVNVEAPMQLVRAVLPQLIAQGEGRIVNIGSMFGSLPFAGFVAYSAAKAALRAFSQGLRRELADTRVAVIHVAPRAIATPLNTPAVDALNRELKTAYDQPEQVAARIVDALRGGAGEHHIGFPEKLFAWINGIAPGVIDNGVAGKLATIKRHATSR